MTTLGKAAAEFLALKRIAVVGVSRQGDQPANYIYRKLKVHGREVFAVNPNADSVEGDPCYPSLRAIPGSVEGAVIVTTPEVATAVVEDCAASGVRQVWFHRSFGGGSLAPQAVERCRELGIRAIPGACPMMFCAPVDPGHRCMRFFLRLFGGLPRPVASRGA